MYGRACPVAIAGRAYHRAASSLKLKTPLAIPKLGQSASPITNRGSSLHVTIDSLMATRRLHSTDAKDPKQPAGEKQDHLHDDHDHPHSHSNSIFGSLTHSHSHGEDGHAHGVEALKSTGVWFVCLRLHVSSRVGVWEARGSRNSDNLSWTWRKRRFDNCKGFGRMVHGLCYISSLVSLIEFRSRCRTLRLYSQMQVIR